MKLLILHMLYTITRELTWDMGESCRKLSDDSLWIGVI